MKEGDAFRLPSSTTWLDRPPLDVPGGLVGHVVVALFCRLGPALDRAALVELALEQEACAGRPVAFVVVHVPNSAAERDPARLRRALAPLPSPLTVAVVDDRAWLAAQGIDASPTLFVVDTAGRVRWRGRGVPRRLRLREAVDSLANGLGTVAAPFVPLAPTAAAPLVPSAIAAAGERVFVACAGRRQVLALDRQGQPLATHGSGVWGASDGPAAAASFGWPVALAVHDDHVVVADAGTHTLRAIALESGEVATWSGFGRLAADTVGGGYGRDQGLSVPNGLVVRDGGCYLSQAGTRQIWQVDPATGASMAWFGGGLEAVSEGRVELVEPAGLAGTGETLWVADAGAGQVVAIDLAHVQPHVAAAGFGRPLALAVHDGELLVADALAGVVAAVSMAGGAKRALFGPEQGLVEPVGLWLDGTRLLVADAAAGAWFEADLSAPALRLDRHELPSMPPSSAHGARGLAACTASVQLREHSDVSLRLPAPFADGVCTVDVVDEGPPVLACARHGPAEVVDGLAEVLLPVEGPGKGCLRVVLRSGGRVARLLVPVEVCSAGSIHATAADPA